MGLQQTKGAKAVLDNENCLELFLRHGYLGYQLHRCNTLVICLLLSAVKVGGLEKVICNV